MKNITDVLNKVGKASTREIAAILDIEVRDMLALLREQEQVGLVERINGHWLLVTKDAAPALAPAAATPAPAPAAILPAPAPEAPLKVIWSAPEEVQEFPTLAWVRQRRRELKNEMRWLSQIENIARQIDRKKAAVAYFREQG
ncbi:hypothetical protein [Pantoea septica]|uniref:hypothetical protein n=1 Tax=Pantoea septica TaxID=472695 RepID=UPI00289D44E5|nr:hypothetical protein [Pantoea septica]